MRRAVEFIVEHPRLALGAAVALALVLTVLYVLVPPVAAAITLVGTWIGIVAIFLWSNREDLEKYAGRGLSWFSWTGAATQRQALASEIQGVINGGRRDLGEEVADLLPFPATVEFVREETDLARLAEGEVVIALKHPRNHAENTAKATLAYVSVGMARAARPYVDRKTMQSVDYSITKKLLTISDRDALDYLLNEMWLPAVERDAELRSLGQMAEAVEAEGWLTRILLAEFLEVGRRLFGRFPPADVQAASRRFLEFLYALAGRRQGEVVELDFRDGEFRVAIVLVGTPELRERAGAGPYIDRTIECHRRRFDVVHLLARGEAIPVLDDAAARLSKDGRVLDVEVTKGQVRLRGDLVDAAFARVILDQSGSSIGRSRSRPT